MKVFIRNRNGQKMAALVEEPVEPKGLAFIMHGLGGFKEQPQLQVLAEVCLENCYTAVRFDTTNTFGESEGDYADATATNYCEDFEDVTSWAMTQPWYLEPFVLVSYSLSGLCICLYAARHPEKVKALAPISTVISGALSAEAKAVSGELEEWQRTGWRSTSSSRPGVTKRLKWSHMEDRMKFDLLPEADKLTMPVLMMVGENDTDTAPKYQKILFDKLPGRKEMHVIPGAPHTFVAAEHLVIIKEIFGRWLKTI